MSWWGVGSAAVSVIGGMYSANKNADAMENANSGDLPDWLRPYIKGGGPIPAYLTEDPPINQNWLDHIGELGQGQYDSEWQPAFASDPQFNPDQTFTPVDNGSPYGALPEGVVGYGEPTPGAIPPPPPPKNDDDEGKPWWEQGLNSTGIFT